MEPRWWLQRGFCNSITQDDDVNFVLGTGDQGATGAVSYEHAISTLTCLLDCSPLIKSQKHIFGLEHKLQIVS